MGNLSWCGIDAYARTAFSRGHAKNGSAQCIAFWLYENGDFPLLSKTELSYVESILIRISLNWYNYSDHRLKIIFTESFLASNRWAVTVHMVLKKLHLTAQDQN